MSLTRRSLLSLMGASGVAGLAACANLPERYGEEQEPAVEETEVEEEPKEPEIDLDEFADLALDMQAWNYDEANDCYYQLGLPYCLTPGSEQYESLSIFVPGAYLKGTKHGRTWECEVDPDATVGGFTPATAPVALPINSPSCSAQECPTSYSYEGLGRYLSAGIVYVYAGFRGRSGGYESTTQEYFAGGAPWLVSDLKAVVRFLRYNASVLPCDTTRVFSFGYGGGAAAAAMAGVSGASELYLPYLQELGAATHDAEGADLSDDLYGLGLWCPMGAFSSSDAAYEWMMGQYSSEGTRADGIWTQQLSRDLADAYASYVNGLGMTDADGNLLQLDRIDDGTFTGGSYYDYLVGLVSEAAGDFLGRTDFPYAAVPIDRAVRNFPGDPMLAASPQAPEAEGEEQTSTGVRQIQATVYDTVESYVSTLNADGRWLTYNASRGETDVTGLWDFVLACRKPSRDVCAYDLIDRSGLANQLFGTDEKPSLHFDGMVAQLVEANHERYAADEGWNEELVAEWRGDLAETDTLELTVADRVAMSDPIAMLVGGGDEDAQKLVVAPHWRINTGLMQAETTFANEVNLALLLSAHEGVSDVAFTPVWGAGYELAEREGDPEDQLVAWMVSCCPEEPQAEAEPEAETDTEAEAETDDENA